MENRQGIYKIVNKSNGKIYYGSTAISFKERWIKHKSKLNNNKHCNIHLQNAWNKYGANNFEFVIILICDKNNCLYYEQIFLDKYWDNGINCYNIDKIAGSRLGFKHTMETKEKMSRHRIGKKLSIETRKKMSESNIRVGRTPPSHIGKIRSEKTKAMMSEARLGKHPSIETRKKMSRAKIGTKLSDATKKLMSNQRQGQKHPMYGKHHTEESKKKQSTSHLGHRPGNAKLTNAEVRDIRRMINNGIQYSIIASQFNISKHIISRIKLGKTYKDVK